MKKYLSLFFLFFKMALCTYGGGYAVLPVITKELIEKRGWLTEEELMDYYAIGQCTPGLIAVNTATFTGNKRAGIPGGIIATLGYVAPSVILMSIISAILVNFADIPVVQNAFFGIRASVCVIILDTLIKLWKKSVTGALSAAIFAFVIIVELFTSLNPVIPVIISGLAGIIINRIIFMRRGCDLLTHNSEGSTDSPDTADLADATNFAGNTDSHGTGTADSTNFAHEADTADPSNFAHEAGTADSSDSTNQAGGGRV